jgi:hypothetical protein
MDTTTSDSIINAVFTYFIFVRFGDAAAVTVGYIPPSNQIMLIAKNRLTVVAGMIL